MTSQNNFLFNSLECGSSSILSGENINVSTITSRNTSSWQKNMEQRIRKLEEISAQNTILLERIIDILQPKKIDLMIFPIKSINDLASTESLLLNKPEAEIVAYLKQKFSKRPLSKILDEVIAESLLLKVNWDGAKKKVALKNYALFNKFLYEALKDDYSYPDFEAKIKKAFLKCKAQFYRNTYNIKKK
ncbi:uncharacterized protein LOC126765746 [Bactrocera neohumeralis]|uniref:uncharacterized protein LOC126765746 n=1 Tax=Bactrocera neohumeralis TaxID=98809 RepID=UPI002164FD68|nr:uncharacterized protein LOC126765746 [Bactrocera neohumeralis]